jgi:hypothetical protein
VTYPHDDDYLDSLDSAYGNAETPEKKADFGPIPTGNYQAKVDRCLPKEGRDGKPERVSWGLVIAGPKCSGRWVWRDYPFTAEWIDQFKRDMYACERPDITPKMWRTDPDVRASLCGLILDIKVQHNPSYPDSPKVYINALASGAAVVDERNPPPPDDDSIPF